MRARTALGAIVLGVAVAWFAGTRVAQLGPRVALATIMVLFLIGTGSAVAASVFAIRGELADRRATPASSDGREWVELEVTRDGLASIIELLTGSILVQDDCPTCDIVGQLRTALADIDEDRIRRAQAARHLETIGGAS